MVALGDGCILCAERGLSHQTEQKVRAWSEFLKAPVNPPDLRAFSFRMHVTETETFLEDSSNRRLKIDFVNDHLNYQRKGLRGKNELLAKALGSAKGTSRVLDLSAGLGIDAVFMTQLGFQVTAVERSPFLYVLLAEALEHASALQSSLSFVASDAKAYLKSPEFEVGCFDAIYFDPMYPHKKKTALPKQEMVVFRELIGDDDDATEVLSLALESPANRVVVKRPTGAELLLPGVRHQFQGKVVRYDLYMR